MVQHILVPLDGSILAECVVPAAAALAQAFAADVTLFHVMEARPPATVHGQAHLTDPEQAQAYLERMRASPIFRDRNVQVHVRRLPTGDVADSLMAHAQELDADLVVLATHGHGGLRDLLFGSIAQQALRRGTTPILRVNPTPQGNAPRFDPKTILVPLDGAAAHEPALPVAARLARAWGATVVLVHAVPTPRTLSGQQAAAGTLLPMATRAMLELTEKGAAEYLQKMAQELEQEGVSVRWSVGRGAAANTVLDTAERESADLVVLATHALGALESFWAKSLTPRLMRGLVQPVLLVRAEGEQLSR
ncbi:MAG: universal stress protein [Burkholderiales bacterium]